MDALADWVSEGGVIVLNRENQERCYELLNIYGPWPQLMMVIEECSELQKECCKMFRERQSNAFVPTQGVVEELVDVIVMCEQLRLMCGLDDEIDELAGRKLKRAVKRARLQMEAAGKRL